MPIRVTVTIAHPSFEELRRVARLRGLSVCEFIVEAAQSVAADSRAPLLRFLKVPERSVDGDGLGEFDRPYPLHVKL